MLMLLLRAAVKQTGARARDVRTTTLEHQSSYKVVQHCSIRILALVNSCREHHL